MGEPVTNIDGNFAIHQEAARKDVEQGFGVLKVKFLSLSHPVQLHHVDDTFYLVNGCIILHNIMVEEQLEIDEEENVS